MRRNQRPRYIRCSPWFACGIAVAILASGCSRQAPAVNKKSAKGAPAEKEIQVIEAKLYPWPRMVRAQGSLIADERVTVGTEVAGRIKEVVVDLGTTVKQGQTIALLDLEEFELRVQQAAAQVAQARASVGLKPGVPDHNLDPTKAAIVRQEKAVLEEARLNLARAKRLSARNVVTTEELQTREAAVNVAQARYDSALNSVQEQVALLALRRAELALAQKVQAYGTIKSPFAGVIQERHVAQGAYVTIGHPVVTLVRTNPLRFRAGVPERSSTRIKVGQQVRLSIENGEAPIVASISRVSPALDVSSRSLIIEADVDNSAGRIRAGLFAEAEIVVGPQDQALAVPSSTVAEFAGVEKVWVVENEKMQAKRVRTGRRVGDLVEIVDGLSAGETILLDADQGRDGAVHAAMIRRSKPNIERPALAGN